MIIRAPEPRDAEELNRAIIETWDQLHEWMPWALAIPTRDESLEVCERMARNHAESKDFPLFCFDQLTGRFILATGIHPRNLAVPSYEIGYWCRASCQSLGYVTEAVQAITAVAFEQMEAERLEIRCDVLNVKSRLVAERCCFGLEGTFRNDCRNNRGELRTTLVFGKTRDEHPVDS